MANVVSAYGPPGSDKITYSLSDQSNITISLTPTDAEYGGYAPVGNNPGDLKFGTNKEYYNGEIGYYQARIQLGIYASKEQGFYGLFNYLATSTYILEFIVNNPSASVGWVERSVTHHFFCHNFGIKAFPIS